MMNSHTTEGFKEILEEFGTADHLTNLLQDKDNEGNTGLMYLTHRRLCSAQARKKLEVISKTIGDMNPDLIMTKNNLGQTILTKACIDAFYVNIEFVKSLLALLSKEQQRAIINDKDNSEKSVLVMPFYTTIPVS